MSPSLAVLIPVLDRPLAVGPLVETLDLSTAAERREGWDVRMQFVVTPGDDAEHEAIMAARDESAIAVDVLMTTWPAGPGDYARKINHAASLSPADWFFTGADDLRFHPGWLRAAVGRHVHVGALVVGTNDLGNPYVMRGLYATHLLVHRDYVERGTIDEPGKLLHEGYDHNCCNPGEAPIWMADMSFKDLGDVAVGDRVIGWERVAAGGMTLKRLAKSDVLATASRKAPIVRVTLASGRTFRCTPDHRWLNAAWSPAASHDLEWVEPREGRTLLHVVDVPTPLAAEHERLAGWLAGIYDGEGSGVYIASQSKRENPDVHAAIGAALATLEIPHTTPDHTTSEVGMFCLTGGRQGYLDFLLRIRPVRRERLETAIYAGNRRAEGGPINGDLGAARFGHRDRIVSVEPDGEDEVFSLTTTTGNYVAWGYASRNCDTELVETAKSRRTFAFAKDSHVEHLHPSWRKGVVDATYRKGREHHGEDRRRLDARRPLWGGSQIGYRSRRVRQPLTQAERRARR